MKLNTLLVSASIIGLAVVAVLSGCKKQEPAAPASAKTGTMDKMENMTHDAAAQADETIEQKICPVMGNPINKDVFVEYQGKKVYFCCPDCKEAFNKDPEKYVSKLPQFKQ